MICRWSQAMLVFVSWRLHRVRSFQRHQPLIQNEKIFYLRKWGSDPIAVINRSVEREFHREYPIELAVWNCNREGRTQGGRFSTSQASKIKYWFSKVWTNCVRAFYFLSDDRRDTLDNSWKELRMNISTTKANKLRTRFWISTIEGKSRMMGKKNRSTTLKKQIREGRFCRQISIAWSMH